MEATEAACGACGMVIETCDVCGGLKCSPGCVDRAEDGCTCDDEDVDEEF